MFDSNITRLKVVEYILDKQVSAAVSERTLSCFFYLWIINSRGWKNLAIHDLDSGHIKEGSVC